VGGKIVTRSIRLEEEFDAALERLAAEQGISVSAYIRAALTDITQRDIRRKRLEAALLVAAQLPDVTVDRDAMWGTGTRVSR
jgi:Arc/MetJ-type ribon-helix-helix transcriptional regulator